MSFTIASRFGIDRSIARSVGSVHRSRGGESPGDMSASGLDEVLRMETFLFGIGCLNAYVIYEVRPGDSRNLSGGIQYPPMRSPNRRIRIQIQDSASDKEIPIIANRSALDCHRRRNNQYPSDLDNGRTLRPFFPGKSYGKPGG
jgi:hypothetical protein